MAISCSAVAPSWSEASSCEEQGLGQADRAKQGMAGGRAVWQLGQAAEQPPAPSAPSLWPKPAAMCGEQQSKGARFPPAHPTHPPSKGMVWVM